MPFPETVDSKKEYDRKHSIRCKYTTIEECLTQRQKMAKMYGSQIRICNFAHIGDRIIKIGHQFRCPSVPNFGNPQTMPQDIKDVKFSDIKNLMMYGLSDIATAMIWFDYHKVKGVKFERLDIC
jgi:hypothetical protein